MLSLLIDNVNIEDYDIKVLDYTPILSIASERNNELIWQDKSGVDKNLANIRYDTIEFQLTCFIKAVNEIEAYKKARSFVEYFFSKGTVVVSLRDISNNIRECFLCERSNTITPEVSIRKQNSLYNFKLGLRDLNPNAIKYYNQITGNATSIDYTKGKYGVVYWGNGDNSLVSNSGTYSKLDYTLENGYVDIIIDVDKDSENVISMVADFTADVTSGVKPQEVNFTDTSTGDVVIWAWDFGDGNTSSDQNPNHTYTKSGTYTVSLQIFNDAKGSDVETKEAYITIRDSRMLVNDSGDFALKNSLGDYGLKN